jgi:ADP-ribose pyrophosphatase YjhB (NUDIX family)
MMMAEIYNIAPATQVMRVKSKALGLIWRDSDLLLEEVREPDGTHIGYRPLGGNIEFGEKSWEALEREFMEELGEDIKIAKLHSVIENIFEWGGEARHEIAFMYEANLLQHSTYDEDEVIRMDVSNGGQLKTAYWKNPFDLPAGSKLLPSALLARLQDKGE